MDCALKTEFFLGANSRYGFHSLYEGFCLPEDGVFLNVIKGGPGCGKSSFMRRIGAAAEKEGLAVEYILCSGDPDSLDGVFIPELKVGYVDGTAPHTIDVVCPGCGGLYLDLGRFYLSDALRPELGRIMDLNHRYRAMYASAYNSIAAAAAALPRCIPGITEEKDMERLSKKAAGFAKREFHSGGKGCLREKFIDALSCRGAVFLSSTVSALCNRIFILDNELGLGHTYLAYLLPMALEKGQDILLCRDCLDPQLISALIFPQLSLALLCSTPGMGDLTACRHVHLDALPRREHLAELRPSIRRAKKLSHECLGFAVDTLSGAKALHDELEKVYNPHVDFDGVYEEAQKHISMLFGT